MLWTLLSRAPARCDCSRFKASQPLIISPYVECPVPCVQLGELLATQPAAAIATETCCSLNLPLLFSFSKFKCTVSYWHLYFILNTKREHSFIQNNLLGLIFLSRNGGKLLWRQRLFRNGKYSEKSQGNHTFII